MITDSIIDELRRVRDEHAGAFGNDIHRICEDYRRMQREHSLPVISLNPVPARPTPPRLRNQNP